MRPTKIIQIETVLKDGVIYLYGLDTDGRVWVKVGGNDKAAWQRV